MTGWKKVAGFVLAAAVAFAAALGIGQWVGPIDSDDDEHGHDDQRIALSPDDGADVELDVPQVVYDAGRQDFRFTVRDAADRSAVTTFDLKHEKLLHLVVVRRDLGSYRHVHPRLDEETGEWSVPLDLDAGSWRVYADFTRSGGGASVAEADLSVAGRFTPTALGADNATAKVDGFDVHLARAGGELALHVTKEGQDVTDLEPYLGAYGHLVAIRAEDLTYLHVHPQEGDAGPEVAFHAGLGEAGRYRLFFEFQHGGKVHRAEFNVTVGGDTDESPAEEEGESGGHDEH